MRTEFLPSRQQDYNAALNKRIRALLATIVTLVVCSILTVVLLWARGERLRESEQPQIFGPDGVSVCEAVVVNQNFVLCSADVPNGSQISYHVKDRSPVSSVQSAQITGQTKLSLLRLASPAPAENQPSSVALPQSGQKAVATSLTEHWEGTLNEQRPDVFDTQPQLQVGPGAPVMSQGDKSLIGVSAQDAAGTVVVSMKLIQNKFPDLKK